MSHNFESLEIGEEPDEEEVMIAGG